MRTTKQVDLFSHIDPVAAIEIALRAYDLGGGVAQFVAGERASELLVQTDRGETFVCRLERLDSREAAEKRSTCIWLEALGRRDETLAPMPVVNRLGDYLTAGTPHFPEGHFWTVFRHMPGSTVEAGAPDEAYARMGGLLAALHGHAEAFDPPAGFVRPRRTGPNAAQCVETVRRSTADRLLPGEVMLALDATAARVDREVRGLGGHRATWGLIHGDFGPRRVRFHEDGARATGFDHCGWGHYGWDVANALLSLPPGRITAFLEGYRARRPVPLHGLETFYVLRTLDELARCLADQATRTHGLSLLRRVAPVLVGRYLLGKPFLEIPASPRPPELRPRRATRAAMTRWNLATQGVSGQELPADSFARSSRRHRRKEFQS